MADAKISALTAAASVVPATDQFVIARAGANRKVAPTVLSQAVVLTGAVNPNGVVTGYQGQLYTQVPGDGTATLWINTTGAMVWV